MALENEDRIKRLTPEHNLGTPASTLGPVERYSDGSVDRLHRFFLGHALDAVKRAGLGVDRVTFVYGDTHHGGVGRLPGPTAGSEVRVYNTGGWVVHSPVHHPPCHLFAVDEEGNEYLADITFNGIKIDGKELLKLAADDFENKKRATSRVLRALLRLVPD